MIYHGRTLTSKVSVREVCEAIMKYAFVASPYPIIISAEIHCGVAQQDMLAKIMKGVFGEALVSAPVDGRPKIDVLPSPDDLKGRVLLKAKNLYVSASEPMQPKGIVVDGPSSETSSSDTDGFTDMRHEISETKNELKQEFKSELKKVGQAFNRVKSMRRHSSNSKPGPLPISSPSSGSFLRANSSSGEEKPKVKMSFELLALLVYTVGVKCRGINKKEAYAPEHVFSLSESTANKLLKEGMSDLIKHNRTHVVRIYPKGVRFSSSNYEPHRYWSSGAQLVALNWQTCGRSSSFSTWCDAES
jgi:phosphatidylinositol phospholipase C delta